MKQFFILTLVFLTLAIPIAEAYPVSYGGFATGSAVHLRQRSPYTGSAVYNYRRGQDHNGFNPYYLLPPKSRANSHIFLRSAVDNAVFQNPGLLEPRYSVNNHRYLRGFNKGHFDIWHAQRGTTGRIRSYLPTKINSKIVNVNSP